jgi:hypothetical protein
MIVISSERMNLVLNGETISFKPVLGLIDKVVVGDGSMRYRKLARLFVGLTAIRHIRRMNCLDCLEIYESAIASADVEINFL